jgi:hypothetical protein
VRTPIEITVLPLLIASCSGSTPTTIKQHDESTIELSQAVFGKFPDECKCLLDQEQSPVLMHLDWLDQCLTGDGDPGYYTADGNPIEGNHLDLCANWAATQMQENPDCPLDFPDPEDAPEADSSFTGGSSYGHGMLTDNDVRRFFGNPAATLRNDAPVLKNVDLEDWSGLANYNCTATDNASWVFFPGIQGFNFGADPYTDWDETGLEPTGSNLFERTRYDDRGVANRYEGYAEAGIANWWRWVGRNRVSFTALAYQSGFSYVYLMSYYNRSYWFTQLPGFTGPIVKNFNNGSMELYARVGQGLTYKADKADVRYLGLLARSGWDPATPGRAVDLRPLLTANLDLAAPGTNNTWQQMPPPPSGLKNTNNYPFDTRQDYFGLPGSAQYKGYSKMFIGDPNWGRFMASSMLTILKAYHCGRPIAAHSGGGAVVAAALRLIDAMAQVKNGVPWVRALSPKKFVIVGLEAVMSKEGVQLLNNLPTFKGKIDTYNYVDNQKLGTDPTWRNDTWKGTISGAVTHMGDAPYEAGAGGGKGQVKTYQTIKNESYSHGNVGWYTLATGLIGGVAAEPIPVP